VTTTAFTKNYSDHSNNEGFQFEFFCDKCGSGVRSAFSLSTMGVATDVVTAASRLIGGFWGAAQASAQVKDMLRGPAWDKAFAAAIEECKPRFRQCTRCGRWMCPEVCWNHDRKLCLECAPDLEREAASLQAHAAVEQARAKIEKVDQTSGYDASVHSAASFCASCGAALTGGKFCGECGKPVDTGKCRKCSAAVSPAAKFCAECGTPR